MCDIKGDLENIEPINENNIVNVELDSSNKTSEKYRAKELEQLLKVSTDPKQYIVQKNNSPFIKSDVWNIFGFPSKIQTNGKHQVIAGFVSCFICLKTLPYDGSTKYMNKHKCPQTNSPNSIENISLQGTIDSDIDVESFLPTAKTISNNVRQLAENYRHALKPLLISQADAGCLCIIPDLWTDKHRKINYVGITCTFVNKLYQQVVIDLCCSEYDEMDKTGASVFLVS
ncbi:unnamed protein product [Adineta steineri]|uniref:Uncharacterized protein n=1 Tax=Adineta steineri TaxID=433720 RepID=A0A819FFS0_9BILA|nr:unnamed protein product [Adineta steineri]CAF3863995.1 unnamed protein product [Adineta steineri]